MTLRPSPAPSVSSNAIKYRENTIRFELVGFTERQLICGSPERTEMSSLLSKSPESLRRCRGRGEFVCARAPVGCLSTLCMPNGIPVAGKTSFRVRICHANQRKNVLATLFARFRTCRNLSSDTSHLRCQCFRPPLGHPAWSWTADPAPDGRLADAAWCLGSDCRDSGRHAIASI